MLIPNVVLSIVLLVSLVLGVLPLAVLFIMATAIALILNYPGIAEQKERLSEHAYNVLAVVSLIFAAGIFTSLLSGTGMLDAMSASLVAVMPDTLGPYMAPAIALLSAPATYVVTNDAFCFGVLPVLAQTGAAYGINAAEMARTSLIGQPLDLLSPLVASTYFLMSPLDLNNGENQRASIPWVLGLVLALLFGAFLTGAIPLVGNPGGVAYAYGLAKFQTGGGLRSDDRNGRFRDAAIDARMSLRVESDPTF